MTRRTLKDTMAGPSARKSKKMFSVNPFKFNMKRKNATVETPKLKSYSATATPGRNLRIVKRAAPTPGKGRPKRVTRATLLSSGSKSKQKKKRSPIKAGPSLVKALNFDGSFSGPSTSSTPANRGSKVSAKSSTAKKRKTRRESSPALKGFVPLTPKTLVARNRSGYLGPPIVVEDDTLITLDQTGEVLDLTASDEPMEMLNGKARKVPDYTLSEGEILTESDDDEIQIVEEKVGAFTRSMTGFKRCTETAQDKGNVEKKRFPAMGLRASSRSKMPLLQQNEQPPQQQSGLSNVVVGTSSWRRTGLRPIVIDGQNVAIGHSIGIGRGNNRFSSRGIDIMVDYFKRRGHDVTVFVPQFRTKCGQADDRHLLEKLMKQGVLSYTPSRTLNGVHINSYDDRYVVQYAAITGGVIVSNDNYQDLRGENPQVTEAIENRLLKFTWVKDTLMFPTDPKGKWGPTLEGFLKF